MRLFLVIGLFIISSWLFYGCMSLTNKPRDSDLAGTYYRVKPGDTLSEIAKEFRCSTTEIMYINGIEDERALVIGRLIFLPDPDPISTKIAILAKKKSRVQKVVPKIEPKKKPAPPQRQFLFPVPGGIIVSRYSDQKKKPYDGLGIKAPHGSPVVASLKGRVLYTGDDGTKFGLIVIIEHPEHFITVYAHLDRAIVSEGNSVAAGKTIGFVGKSGGATTAHLHFQIRLNERPQNPEKYLALPSKK